jgi:hypothetical protein
MRKSKKSVIVGHYSHDPQPIAQSEPVKSKMIMNWKYLIEENGNLHIPPIWDTSVYNIRSSDIKGRQLQVNIGPMDLLEPLNISFLQNMDFSTYITNDMHNYTK